jgi:hypothetical protein
LSTSTLLTERFTSQDEIEEEGGGEGTILNIPVDQQIYTCIHEAGREGILSNALWKTLRLNRKNNLLWATALIESGHVIQRAETLKKAVLYRLWTAKNFPGGLEKQARETPGGGRDFSRGLEKQARETPGGGDVGRDSSGGLDKQAREAPGEEDVGFVFPGALDKQGRDPPAEGDLGNEFMGGLDKQAREAPGEESMGFIFPVGLNKRARATPGEGYPGNNFSGGLERQARETPEAGQGAVAEAKGAQRTTEPEDMARVDKSASVGKSEGTRGSLAEPSAEGPVGAAGPSTQLVPYQGAMPLVPVQGPPVPASRSRFKRTSKMVTTDASLRKDLILNKLQVSKAGNTFPAFSSFPSLCCCTLRENPFSLHATSQSCSDRRLPIPATCTVG